MAAFLEGFDLISVCIVGELSVHTICSVFILGCFLIKFGEFFIYSRFKYCIMYAVAFLSLRMPFEGLKFLILEKPKFIHLFLYR